MTDFQNSPAVLVVGAGPTGLLLASELQRRDVPCHLIDAQPAPLHWDRATVVHPRSLEVSSRWDSSIGSSRPGADSDAAHVCSPAEGHGMNCGLQDAFNLAWKLALVHHGFAAPSLLDSYEAERRPALQELITDSPLFEAAIFLGTHPDLPVQIEPIEPAGADLLGVKGITLLVVRPDGYVGLRSDRDHLSALEQYRKLVHAGYPSGLSAVT